MNWVSLWIIISFSAVILVLLSFKIERKLNGLSIDEYYNNDTIESLTLGIMLSLIPFINIVILCLAIVSFIVLGFVHLFNSISLSDKLFKFLKFLI